MSVRSAQAIKVLFTTRVFATGVGTNADSLPAGTLYVNGVSNAATVTVANVSTGLYTASVTLPTLTLSDLVEILITATVSSITDSAVIWGDTKDFFAGSVPDVAAGGSGGMFIAGTNDHCTITNNLLVSGTTTLTGNVLLSGTLTVSGAVAFSSTFAVTTSTSLGAFSCTTLTASGAVALQGTVTVTGAVLFSSTFATTGTTTFNAFTVTNNLLVSGNATVSGTTTLTGAVSLGSTLGVTGTTTFAAIACTTLASSGTVTFNAFTCTHNFTVSGNWLTTGTTTWTGAMSANGGVTFQSSSGAGMIIISTSSGNSGLEIGGSAAADIALVGTGLFSADIYGRLLGNTGVSSDSIAGVGAQVDLQTIKGETVTCAAGVTIYPNIGSAHELLVNSSGYVTYSNAVPTNFSSLGITSGGKISEVVLVDTLTTYTNDTPQSGDSFALIGTTGSGLTSLAPAATALSTATWTATIAGYITGPVALESEAVLIYNRLGAPAGASVSADIAAVPGSVWDVAISGHLTTGTTGKALNAAGSSGDPWATDLPGAYGAGTAGYIVGNNAAQTGDSYAIVNNGTYGNSAIHSQISAVQSTANTINVNTSATAGYVTGPVALETEAVLIYNRLGAPAGASVSADIAALEAGVNVSSINSVSTSNVAAVNAYVGTASSLVNTSGKLWVLDGNGNAVAPASTALSTAVWTGAPTGFLAATFPSGTIANTTNITGGTITTATNLTNAPTAGDFTATMKTSIGTAVAGSAVASVTGNVGGNVVGSVGSVIATVSANLVSILGTALTETTGYLAAAFKKFFNIATPTLTTAGVNQSGDSYPIVDSGTYGNAALLTAIGSASAPTVAEIVTGIFTDTTSADFTTVGSPGYLLMHQVENAFNNSTSSIFNVSALSNAPGGSGTGPGVINVLVTVTDGVNPLQNVLVRMFVDNSHDVTLVTNASGQITFTLTAATWTVSMYLPGYIFTPTTVVVASDITPTYAMTALSFAPSPPGTTTGVLYTYDDEMVIQTGIVVTCKIKVLPPALSGIAVSTTAQSITSDDTGLCQFAGLIPGATYILSRGNQTRTVTIPASAGSTYELPGLIGTP